MKCTGVTEFPCVMVITQLPITFLKAYHRLSLD
jgi:hypothetical protein